MKNKYFTYVIILAVCFTAGCKKTQKQEKQLTKQELKKDYQKLSDYYEKQLLEKALDQNVLIEAAQFYYDFRDYEKVVSLLSGKENLQAKIILAKAYSKLQKDNLAIEIFDQLEEIKDDEANYLYGKVLENKNLFPKALKVYQKAEGNYKTKAEKRIEDIKSKVEENIPQEIKDLLDKSKDFIGNNKDEALAILLVDENIEIKDNNSSVTTVHVIKKVLQERGKASAEVNLGYDSTYERVELDYARTISPKGTMIYAGKENIRNIGRYQNFPLYSNSKAFIVSMPMVEVGSIIEYKVKIISSKLAAEDNFSFTYRLRESSPIYKAKFVLSFPSKKKTKIKFFNEEYLKGTSLEPKKEDKDGKTIYSWEFNKIDPIIPEYSMPPTALINPAFAISSFSSWEEIYSWWKSLYEDKVFLEEDAKQFVKKLTKDAKTDFEKANAIHKFCAQDIRYVAIEYGEGGHEPHLAQDVFVNRYGDCKDQAILCVAMMSEAGLKAYPVLIPTRGKYQVSKDFPSINFNHAICAVEINGKLIFIDPTSETTSFTNIPLGDQNRMVFVFEKEQGKLIRTPVLKDNFILTEMTINLNNSEGAEITRELTTKGFFTSGHRWYLKYTHPSTIKEDIQTKMVLIAPTAVLQDYEITQTDDLDLSPVLKYKFSAKDFLIPAGSLRIMNPLNVVKIDYQVLAKEERKFAVDFDSSYGEKGKVEIILPKNLKVYHLPKEQNQENKWFKYKAQYTIDKNKIIFDQEIFFKTRFVEPKEYKDFKKELEKTLQYLRERVVLKRA